MSRIGAPPVAPGASATSITNAVPVGGTIYRTGYAAPGVGQNAAFSITGSLAAVAATTEHRLETSWAGNNVLSLCNTDNTGFSVVRALDLNKTEAAAWGYGNPGTGGGFPFAGTAFWESSNLVRADGTFVYGTVRFMRIIQTGKVDDMQNFFARQEFDQEGNINWYDLGTGWPNQNKRLMFTREGYLVVRNTAAPKLNNMPSLGDAAVYTDPTTGAAKLKVRARQNDGRIVVGSFALAVDDAVFDQFTAADSATTLSGAPATHGGNWAISNADNWGYSSNKAYRSSGAGASVAYIDSGLTAGYVEADITLSAVRASVGLVARYVDASNFVYAQINANKVKVYQIDATVFTQLGADLGVSAALGSTHKLGIEFTATQIRVYWDGALIGTFTVGTHAAATKQGLFMWIGGVDDDGGSRWDNYQVAG